MRRRLAVPALALLAAPGLLPAQGPPALGASRVAGQVGAGVLLTPVGFVAAGIATERVAEGLGASQETASRVARVGGFAGAALGAAGGAALVGARGPGRGSFGAAAAGGAAGVLGGALLVRLGERLFDPDDRPKPPCRVRCVLLAAGAVVLPSVGATVGYNLSR